MTECPRSEGDSLACWLCGGGRRDQFFHLVEASRLFNRPDEVTQSFFVVDRLERRQQCRPLISELQSKGQRQRLTPASEQSFSLWECDERHALLLRQG